MKILILLFLFISSTFAFKSNVLSAYAVSIYDKKLKEEKIQKKRITSKNYEGVVYTKIHLFGKLYNETPRVKIGNSIGKLIKTRNITSRKILIGKELTYKHYTVSQGYIEVRVKKKLLDKRVFVK